MWRTKRTGNIAIHVENILFSRRAKMAQKCSYLHFHAGALFVKQMLMRSKISITKKSTRDVAFAKESNFPAKWF